MYTTHKHGLAAYLELLGYGYYPVVSVNPNNQRIEVEFCFEDDLDDLANRWERREVNVNAKDYFVLVKRAKNTVTRLVRDARFGGSDDADCIGNK